VYDKETIDRLFTEYCATEDPKIFEELIGACRPLVSVILSKYPSYSPWFEDISQEVLLKMWKNLRNPDQLKRHLVAPTNFLYTRIWPYIYYSLAGVSKQNGIPMALSEKERLIIKLKEDEELSFDQISEATELAPSTVRCLFYIGRQKRDRMIRIDSDDQRGTGEVIGEFLDPAKQLEISETRKGWCLKVLDRLSSHPYYKNNRKALARVKKLLQEVLEESGVDDQS